MSDYYVQFLDSSGWRTCVTLDSNNTPQRLQMEMEMASRYYPGCRIRVVDQDGRLIDMLT